MERRGKGNQLQANSRGQLVCSQPDENTRSDRSQDLSANNSMVTILSIEL